MKHDKRSEYIHTVLENIVKLCSFSEYTNFPNVFLTMLNLSLIHVR
jgi:hypothetical protein